MCASVLVCVFIPISSLCPCHASVPCPSESTCVCRCTHTHSTQPVTQHTACHTDIHSPLRDPLATREPHSRRSMTLQMCHQGIHTRHTQLHTSGPSALGPTAMRKTQNPKGPDETPCGGDRECCTKTYVSTLQSHPRDTLTVEQPLIPAPATNIQLLFFLVAF